jgi:two-component SAPR family response regulator
LRIADFDHCLQLCHHIDDGNIDLAEKALESYKGMLLEDSYYSWATEAQQHYEVACLELLSKL